MAKKFIKYFMILAISIMMISAISSRVSAISSGVSTISSGVSTILPGVFPQPCTTPLNAAEFKQALDTGVVTASLISVNAAAKSASSTVTNNANCPIQVSLSSYKVFDNWILSTQEFLDGTGLVTIPIGSAQTLSVKTADCKTQVDLWYGLHPFTLLDSNPYGYPNVPFVITSAFAQGSGELCQKCVPNLGQACGNCGKVDCFGNCINQGVCKPGETRPCGPYGRSIQMCDNACSWKPCLGFCGDGTLDAGEECDDGNNINGDGCSADCKLENFEIPEFTSIGAGLVLAGAGAYMYRRRSRK